MYKHKTKTNLVVVISILSVGIIILICSYNKNYSIVDLTCSNGFIVKLRSPRFWEISKTIDSEVTNGKEVIVPLHMIGGTTEKVNNLNFQLIESSDNDVVALIEADNPNVALALFNFKKKIYWPYRNPTETMEASYREGQVLLGMLNHAVKLDVPLILSSDVPGNIDLKVDR